VNLLALIKSLPRRAFGRFYSRNLVSSPHWYAPCCLGPTPQIGGRTVAGSAVECAWDKESSNEARRVDGRRGGRSFPCGFGPGLERLAPSTSPLPSRGRSPGPNSRSHGDRRRHSLSALPAGPLAGCHVAALNQVKSPPLYAKRSSPMGRFDQLLSAEVCSTLPADFTSTLSSPAIDLSRLSALADPGDCMGGSWETAWIDLGGEG